MYFTIGIEGEIETKRFFQDSSELVKLIDRILDKYDDHPSIKIIRAFFTAII